MASDTNVAGDGVPSDYQNIPKPVKQLPPEVRFMPTCMIWATAVGMGLLICTVIMWALSVGVGSLDWSLLFK